MVDNFFTGSHSNLKHHIGKSNFELIRHDVVEPILLEARSRAARRAHSLARRRGDGRTPDSGRRCRLRSSLAQVDQIYHLACPASPVHYKYNPVKTIKTNVMGTLNMLGLAKRVKARPPPPKRPPPPPPAHALRRPFQARFLLTSTSEVYGDPLQHPQTEECVGRARAGGCARATRRERARPPPPFFFSPPLTRALCRYWGNVNPIGERSCYDEGKRVAETLAFDYHREHGVDVRVARIFNTYGPRMALDDGRVVSNFVSQALRGEPLTVYGDGSQTRSFQYCSDLVAGLVALMEGSHTGPFNIGNPNEFTMLQLAHVVKEVVNPDAPIVYRENTSDDPSRRKPDSACRNVNRPGAGAVVPALPPPGLSEGGRWRPLAPAHSFVLLRLRSHQG